MVENTYDVLRDAIWNDDVVMLQQHMCNGRIDVNHTDAAGQTLLHLAAFWGRTEIVRVLISLGGSMKTKNATGCTALDLAIHWGHSATAEIIRLRGGVSVWEEKMGLLQMQVEDLETTLVDVERQNREQETQLAAHRIEIVALHTKWTEAVDKFTAEVARRTAVEAEAATLTVTLQHMQTTVQSLKDELHESALDGFRIDKARTTAEAERDAALAHRDDAIAAQRAALDAVDERTRDWQASERAAVTMETQRNLALAERDHAQRRATLAHVELELLAERLAFAQKAHADIEEEAADFLHAKREEALRARRAMRAMEEFTAEKKIEAMAAAKAFAKQHDHRRGNVSRERKANRCAQTAEALWSQQTTLDLHAFEQEFVHTVHAFTEARQDKWTAVHVQNQVARHGADRAALRPLTSHPSTSSSLINRRTVCILTWTTAS
ncbi:Aste57867_5590 [Aphanomyces stellatus]|uniref:Aste57867_5590 protein n=1 Tax=Aphanomyces stellatus TaxID=120398 RepID=A0A485KHG0_9STRA|nr:hypothetical protein As57867_005577 [Aphanomyces stellatus]VFT82636.1 Aste57867_5590 [Aphanomyces stellatus]